MKKILVNKSNESSIKKDIEKDTRKIFIGQDYYHVFDSKHFKSGPEGNIISNEQNIESLDDIFEKISYELDANEDEIVLENENISITKTGEIEQDGVFVGVYSVHLTGYYNQGWMLDFFSSEWFDRNQTGISFTLLQSYEHLDDDKTQKVFEKSMGSLNAADDSIKTGSRLSEQKGALKDLQIDMARKSEFYDGRLRLIFKAKQKNELEGLVASFVKFVNSNNTFVSGYKYAITAPPVVPVFGQVEDNIIPIIDRSSDKYIESGLQSAQTIAGSTIFPMSFASSRDGLYLGNREFDYMSEPVLEDFTQFSALTIVGSSDSTFDLIDFIVQSNLIDGGKVEAVSLHIDAYKGFNLGNAMTVLNTKDDPINIFEFFGQRRDTIEIYNSGLSRMAKSLLMFIKEEEISTNLETSIKNILKRFFISKNVWSEDADGNLDYYRVVGVEHESVNRFSDFTAYLSQELTKARHQNAGNKDELELLYNVFSEVISSLGPYMDKITSKSIDKKLTSPYNIVDLTNVMNADSEGAKAALLMSYISRILAFEDVENEIYNHFTLVLYDCDFYNERTLEWLSDYIVKFNARREFARLSKIKIIYHYNDVKNAIVQKDFNNMMTNSFISSARLINLPILKEIVSYHSFPDILQRQLVAISEKPENSGYDNMHFMYLNNRATIFTEGVVTK